MLQCVAILSLPYSYMYLEHLEEHSLDRLRQFLLPFAMQKMAMFSQLELEAHVPEHVIF